MTTNVQLNQRTLDWLLEPDSPGVRHLALRDLCDRRPDDPDLLSTRWGAHQTGPIAEILSHMEPAGYWVKPGPGYGPKYFSTVWAIIALGQLGASVDEDEQLQKACKYVLDHTLMAGGQFSTSSAPSGTIDCLQGNLCRALLELGCQDPRLALAFEWMARTVSGEGMAGQEDRHADRRYYAYKSGPTFACGANNKHPCAWGAVKVMLAFAKLPPNQRTPLIQKAIDIGVDFLFSVDPATAGYPTPTGGKPNQSWWKFAFPSFYVTDILQIAETLVGLGYTGDARLANALDLIRSKQDEQGRWKLEYNLTGKTWVDFGKTGQPNKWVTLRALRVLKAG